MFESIGFWILFHLFLLAMIYIDLKVFHRDTSKVTLKSSSLCCLFWISIALCFNSLIASELGFDAALTFFTAYLLESSLSIDNLFLFLVVFSFFQIKIQYQHRVLFLGILGALVFRLSFILLGVTLLEAFEWMYILFGAFLCFSAACFFWEKNEKKELKNSLLVKWANSLFRVYEGDHRGRFFVKIRGKRYVTTLFLALFLIEIFDIIFAVDSVPAVLAITSNVFLAYTSNVFAVLGLRSFYFLLAHLKEKFQYLKTAIAFILFFVGIKLILIPFYAIPSRWTFIYIVSAITLAIAISLVRKKKTESQGK